MPAELAVPVPTRATRATRRSPSTVAFALSAGRAARSGALWGVGFGLAVASVAVSYASIYPTPASRDALEATYGSSEAMSALFGPARQLQTVAGFTAFKLSMALMVLGAVWGLLTSTLLLRGEEDSGRWDLLVAGQTTRRRATVQAVAGLGVGVTVLWAVAAVLITATGRSAKVHVSVVGSLYFALAMVATAVIFLGIGAVTSQLTATRRRAASLATVVLGASYAVRVIADAGTGLHGLVWITPLGWVEELRPLTAPQPLALLPIGLFTVALIAAAVTLAGRRDVGAGIVADRTHANARLGLLVGPTGLAIRLTRTVVIGWWVAIAVVALLYGLIANSAGVAVSGSVREVFARLGAPGGGADAVLGLCFLMLAVLIGFAAAGQVTAVRVEESEGTLGQLLVRPVARWSWLGSRSGLALGVLVVAGVAAGLFAWAGAATENAGSGLAALLEAGVNLVPPSMVILGAGILAFGFLPRATSWVVYGLLAWSLLLVVAGGVGTQNHWILDTSVFHQMASAPAVAPHWGVNAVMAAIGVGTALIGGWGFARRDVQGD